MPNAGPADPGTPQSGPAASSPARAARPTDQPSPESPPAAIPTDGAAVPEAASSGRHTVPDELVRAATYRLPADRVFRAKVRDTATPPESPDDPPTRLSDDPTARLSDDPTPRLSDDPTARLSDDPATRLSVPKPRKS